MEAELSPETHQRRLIALGLNILGELSAPREHQIEHDLLDRPEDVHDLGDLDLATSEGRLDGGQRVDVPGFADRAAREDEHLLRPLGNVRRDLFDALEVRFLAKLNCTIDPLDEPAQARPLDNLAAMPATGGVHFFSGALDEKPRVDYLTTLQHLGFSYHVD
ncbi:MAG: hypothetical protein ACHQ4F_12665 [Candidatus Dormibacteria bacterium]